MQSGILVSNTITKAEKLDPINESNYWKEAIERELRLTITSNNSCIQKLQINNFIINILNI